MPERRILNQRRRDNEMTAREGLRMHGLGMALFLIAVGIQFVRPGETFLSANIYREMAKTASEETWGGLMLMLGCVRVAFIVSAFMTGDRVLTAIGSCIMSGSCAALWFKVAMLFFAVNPLGWSCLAACLLTYLDAITCIYVARIAGTSNRRIIIDGTRHSA